MITALTAENVFHSKALRSISETTCYSLLAVIFALTNKF